VVGDSRRPHARLVAQAGCPRSAAGAARALEGLVRVDPPVVLQAGRMLRWPCEPGPVWASPEELEGAWLGEPVPFSQAHGHVRAYWFDRGYWTASLPLELRQAAAGATTPADEAAHRLRYRLDGHELVSVDPGFGARRPSRPLVPFVLDGARLADAPPGTVHQRLATQ